MLDDATKEQLRGILSELSSTYTLLAQSPKSHPKRSEMMELLEEVAATSPKIELTYVEYDDLRLSIAKDGEISNIQFRALPTGHEFSSLLLALLNLDGKGKNLPDYYITQRIKQINAHSSTINLTTYISLSCTNCPEVVQALNTMAIINPSIHHTIVDGALNKEEVERLAIQSVPTVFADGKLLHVGRSGIGELLAKLEEIYGTTELEEIEQPHSKQHKRGYDVVVAGAGPAGCSAALYLARKGLRVAIVAERIGGQVNETSWIENIPSITTTTGSRLAQDLQSHLAEYSTIEILSNRIVVGAELEARTKRLKIGGGEVIEGEQLIIATGAEWRKLGVEGESDYIGRGVAFCPHCDGPLFEGRTVAVVGGGNSGVEAAIDLAGICSKVYLLEFMESLKADNLLQERLRSASNIEIYTSYQTTKILGDGTKVVGIEATDRTTGNSHLIELDGIFIQIGLSANSSIFADLIDTTATGEIVVDSDCRTSQPGIYAAGDVTTTKYKQIVISMGEGAKAALTAFGDRVAGTV
ncbi:MAG: alkyl hydroperoxide reductase subunit F [Rikenellaceae bacterium]